MVERKYWLSAKTPANPAQKMKNFWIFLGVALLPLLLIDFLVGGPVGAIGALLILAFMLSPWLLMLTAIWKYLEWIEAQPRFSFEKPLTRLTMQNYRAFVNFTREDLTRYYEDIARLLHAHALENPAPEIDFVIVDRGAHTNGLLT